MSLEVKQKALEDALSEARDIAQRTDLNEEERTDLVARVGQIERLKSEVAEDIKIRDILKDETGAPEEVVEKVVLFHNKSMGEAYVESPEFLRAKAANYLGNSEPFSFKAEPTPITSVGDSSAVPGFVIPERVGTVYPLPTYPTRVAALIPNLSTGGNAITYFVETSETTDMGPALEGAEKPKKLGLAA